MAKIIETLQKLASSQLPQGEELLAGLRVNLKGTAFGIGLSLLSVQLGSEVMDAGQKQADDVSIPLTQQMALGLTARQIIVWKRDSLSGKPTKLLGYLPLKEISSVSFKSGFLGDQLTLNFSEDKTLELEAVKVDKGKAFASKLQALLAHS